MLITAAATLDRLVPLTAPGASVAPVVIALDEIGRELGSARPALEQAKASTWLLGQVDRVRGGTGTLRDALQELTARDGMTTFDASFAADDASWDSTFAEYAEIVSMAQAIHDGATARTRG